MRTSISLIVLGVLVAPAVAQPGQTPADPYPQPLPDPQPSPYPQPPPYQPPPPDARPMPPGTRATFVSTGETRWDVRLDSNAVCTTPCAVVIEPLRFVTLHSQDRSPSHLAVGYLPPGDVLVQAKPRAQGAFAVGVTFTSLSGMGLATGITLTAVGCATDRSTMCQAGLITGAQAPSGSTSRSIYSSVRYRT